MSLDGVNLKLARGRDLAQQVRAEVQAFLAESPYSLDSREDGEGNLLTHVRVHAQPPLAWAGLIGDAIHNLRTAFDHIAWLAVLGGGGTPCDQTQFPFMNDASKLSAEMNRRLKGAPDAFRKLVTQAAPFPPGDLWLIHRLDIIDKHHMLLPVGSAHTELHVTVHTPWPFGDDPGETIQSPTLVYPTLNNSFPLTDGQVVLRVMAAARAEGSPNVEHNLRFDVVFGPQVVEVQGQSLLALLDRVTAAAWTAAEPLLDHLRR